MHWSKFVFNGIFVVIRVCNLGDMRKIIQKFEANYVKKIVAISAKVFVVAMISPTLALPWTRRAKFVLSLLAFYFYMYWDPSGGRKVWEIISKLSSVPNGFGQF